MTGRRSAALVFGIGSRHALGKFGASSRHLWGRKKQGGRKPQCSRSRIRMATLGDQKSQKSYQNWSPKQTKTRQNRTQWKIAVMSALKTTFGGTMGKFEGRHRNFWVPLGSILAPKAGPERLPESKPKVDQLLKGTFEAPGTILGPFWSPKWSQSSQNGPCTEKARSS